MPWGMCSSRVCSYITLQYKPHCCHPQQGHLHLQLLIQTCTCSNSAQLLL
jgi:hypothetical protein